VRFSYWSPSLIALTLLCLAGGLPRQAEAAALPAVSHATERVQVGGRTMSAEVVRVRLDQVRMQVGLAGGRVGATEALASIARRHSALAAINGSFFAAYANSAIKPPDQTLVTGGRFVHMGNVGAAIGFDSAGRCRIGRPRWAIRGTRGGSSAWPHSWFAYWLNRPTSASAVTIYDGFWAGPGAPAGGTNVTVQGGRVAAIAPGPTSIPANGYVVHFHRAEPKLLSTFTIGQTVDYAVLPKAGTDPFWANVQEAVGAGPMLVDNGEIALDPVAEGFTSPKILSQSAARSAVGVTADGTLLLVATTGTITQVATLMQALGCVQALNLDGGASSGLWLDGRYRRAPGRPISNALLVMPR
jgi:hypothetical protein